MGGDNMLPNVNRLVCLLVLGLGLAGCVASSGEPDWTWIQVGQTDKGDALKWFGEPQSEFINPREYGNQPPWEYWLYEGGVNLGFQDSVVEVLWIPKHLDPLLQNGYTVQHMLTDYGLPEVVYEYYTESTEGIGINGWLFVYPTHGDEFVISSMFVILSGEPNQPPPPSLDLMRHGRWVSTSIEEWLEVNDERIVFYGGTQVKDIDDYFRRVNPSVPYQKPVAPPQ
jgi:hypothetical protein